MPIAMALLCALTFTTTSALHAQEGPISGQVVDQNTGEGALLATLIYLNNNNETIGGTTTDMDGFDVLNENPNQPTEIGAEALLLGAIRSSVNASVNMSFLVGNNIAQLSAKTLRVSVDIYQWNSYNNFVWDPLYES